MTSLRQEADADVDALFPADRLRAQQQEIARRLESIGRAARVISFPGSTSARRTHPSTTRLAMRWIAGAAAAGLFVGVAAGTFFDFGTRFEFGMRGRRGLVQRTVREAGGQTLPAHMAAAPAVTTTTLAGRGRRRVHVGARPGARSAAHLRTGRLRRAHAARARARPVPVTDRALASLIFRKGLDLKHAVAGMLADNYHSGLVEQIKADDFTFRSGRLTVHLAREFGFCYGVDRAVDYAYQTRERFPDRRVFLTGEIIHNPHVNEKLRAMGIEFMGHDDASVNAIGQDDVVILPAFGVTVGMLERLDRRGCTLIDTTCGSVLNVWKNVRRYAEGGYTSVIHGKVWHEETQATASQAVMYGGRYLVRVRSRRSRAHLRFHQAS